MKFRFKRRSQKSITLSNDDFAVLKDFSNGKSTYDFIYTINSSTALEQGGLMVKIAVMPILPVRPPSIFNSEQLSNKPSPVLLTKNIQQITAVKKDVKNANVNAQIANVVSDFTTKISNLAPLAAKAVKKFKLNLAPNISQQNKVEPIMQATTLVSASINQSFNALAVNSILLDKEDPSNIDEKFNINTSKAFNGLISPAQIKPKAKKFASKLVQKTLNQSNITTSAQAAATAVIPIVSQEISNFVKVNKTISFEAGSLPSTGEFIVKFSLIGSNGLVLESVERKVEHAQNVKVIQTPTVPPTISSTTTLPARNLLTITQNDPLATSVDVYRKEFKKTQRLEDHKYVLVGNVEVTKSGGPVPFEDLVGNASNIVYRVIPKGAQNQEGPAFTNKVVSGYNFGIPRERTPRLLYAGIIAQPHNRGVRIEVVGLAPGVTSVKLLSRDRTKNETSWTVVPSLVGRNLTTLVNDTNQSYVFLDEASKINNVIEYAVMLIFKNGDEEISTTREVYINTPFSFGVVNTTMSVPKILQTNNGIDIQFDISSNINNKNISTLKDLLEAQGQADLFQTELLNEKTSLNDLIAHQIRRIDLETGETNFFRTFTGKRFSDERNRAIDGIKPLVPGRVYRYIVSALLRAPETLFENNTTSIANSIGINVQILPLKFKHPIVSKYGNIVSPSSLNTNYSEQPFEFGNVGNFVYQDVSTDIAKPKAFNAKVIRFNKDTNIVRWNITGEKSLLDHFLVILNRFGDEEIIGKVHTVFNSNVIEFIDRETPKEPGSYKYKIVPVQKDFTHAPAAITQEVI